MTTLPVRAIPKTFVVGAGSTGLAFARVGELLHAGKEIMRLNAMISGVQRFHFTHCAFEVDLVEPVVLAGGPAEGLINGRRRRLHMAPRSEEGLADTMVKPIRATQGQ
jgi:hypothetical protein